MEFKTFREVVKMAANEAGKNLSDYAESQGQFAPTFSNQLKRDLKSKKMKDICDFYGVEIEVKFTLKSGRDLFLNFED